MKAGPMPSDSSPSKQVSPPSEPLVSALVSTYASARFMASLLADLEAQTIADRLEIVVIDSNSPQNEGEIVRAFQQRYANIVYLRTDQRENSHVSLNRAIGLARGKYVTLANTDDRHEPDAYARLAAVLEARPDVALAYADIALTKSEADITGNLSYREAELVGYYRWPEFHPVSFFQQCYAGPQPMWRRDLHAKYGGFDPEFFFAGDYEFWLRLIANGEIFVHLPQVLGLMLHSSASNSHSHLRPLEEEAMRGRKRYWPPQMGELRPGGPAYLEVPDAYQQREPEKYPGTEKVSVLIRVGRQPELLLETLATVLGQKYPNIELILLNREGLALDDLLAGVPQLPPTLVLNTAGLDDAQARNLGLRLATGAHVFLLRSGDRWHGGHLLSHLKALQTRDFTYSEAYRLPHRRTSALLERLARDANNTPDLSLGSLLGQFVASVALGFRRELLRSLPYDGAKLSSPAAAARWQSLEALRRSGFFGAQTERYPDWDLQLLALEQSHPQRLRGITCEYIDPADPLPDGKPLLQRIGDSQSLLAAAPKLPAQPGRSLILLIDEAAENQPAFTEPMAALGQHADLQLIVVSSVAGLALPAAAIGLVIKSATEPLTRLRYGLALSSSPRVTIAHWHERAENLSALMADGANRAGDSELRVYDGASWTPLPAAEALAGLHRSGVLEGRREAWEQLLKA